MGNKISRTHQKRLGKEFLSCIARNDYEAIKYLYLEHSEDLSVEMWKSYLATQKHLYKNFNMNKLILDIIQSDMPIYTWLLCNYHNLMMLDEIISIYSTGRITKKSLIDLADHMRDDHQHLIKWMIKVGVPPDAFYKVRKSIWSRSFRDTLDTIYDNSVLKFDIAVILRKRENHPLMAVKDLLGVIYDMAHEEEFVASINDDIYDDSSDYEEY